MGKRIGKGIAIGICVIAFMFAFGWVVMMLWNTLIPEIFNGPVVTYWQAVGLLVLARLLVGRGWGGWGGGGHWGHKRQYWKRHWREKLESMTPEEREKFLAGMKGRCGWYFRGEWDEKKEEKEMD